MKKDIDSFHIDIFRENIKQQYSHRTEDIFQQLCFDLLSVKTPSIRLIPFKTKGKDGSIDHYGWTDNDESIIIECKKNDDQNLAITALKALSTKLQTSLSGSNAKNNLYKPWFNNNFKHYHYCTSATFSAPKDLEDFKIAIQNMFTRLSAINGLGHLKDVSIELFAWNELKEIIKKNAFCEHTWIDHKIVGASYLNENFTEKSRYKRNLYSSELPYISRVTYKQKFPSEEIETEDEIFNQLFTNDSYSGLLIHGQGGVGKTRLMLELGFKGKTDEWLVLKITKSLNTLQDLDLKPNQKYCLLFDYIEENRHFTYDIIDILYEYFPTTEIKIIATSRSSFLVFNDIPKDFFDIDVSRNIEYIQFVTNEIIRTFNLNIQIDNIKPSFAVFLKEDKNGDESKDFKVYITSRLYKTLQKEKFANIDNSIFTILTSLPFKKNLYSELDVELDLLERDGWITEENGEYSSEHDTIIDELIELFLAQQKFKPSQKKDEITKLFKTTQNKYSTFRTFDRISDWILNKQKIADYAFFANIIKSFDTIDLDTMNLISKTALIDEKNRFSIFAEKSDQYNDYINNFMFVYPLSFAINQSAKNSAIDDNIVKILDKWTDVNLSTISNHAQSYRIISTVIKAFGVNHRISPSINTWLDTFPLQKETSFVLKAWLDAKGDTETVREYIQPWLEAFPLEMETSFVLKAWLDAKGDTETVHKYIQPWLEAFPLEMETNFVFQAWLDTKGDTETVHKYIQPWLEAFPLEMETSFVLQAWLDTKGDTETVHKYIQPWLEAFPLEMETSFVLRAWLDAKGDTETVHKYIQSWLEAFPLEMETSFVLQVWLDAKGDTETVHKYIQPWLETFPLQMETSFVLRAWLDAKGDNETVHKYIQPWLEAFPLNKETNFVLRAWLNAHGELSESMIESLYKWIQINEHYDEIDFVLKRIFKIPKSKLTSIPNDITNIAFQWCEKNIDSTEVLFMLSYMSKFAKFHPKYLPSARVILEKYINSNLNKNEILAYESVIYTAYQNRNFIQISDIELLQKWINSEYSFTYNGSPYINKDKNYYNKLTELSQGTNNHHILNKLNIFFNESS